MCIRNIVSLSHIHKAISNQEMQLDLINADFAASLFSCVCVIVLTL